MISSIRTLAGLAGLTAVLLLQACGNKTEEAKAPASAPAASASAAASAPQSASNFVVDMKIAKDSETPPAASFPADVPKLVAFFVSTGATVGDKFRVVWIAEDVGAAAPKETKIDEATVVADKADFNGGSTLSKPTNGWPVGKYRAELYVGEKMVKTAKFAIE